MAQGEEIAGKVMAATRCLHTHECGSYLRHVAKQLAAIEALARMRHPDASAALARGLDDPVAAVRSAAIGAFGRLGNRGVSARVAELRDLDPDDGVRRCAAAVCERYGWSR